MGTPAVLIRKSTGEIIKHADYPREDMQLVVGLDPDLEWLVKYTPFVRPDYDSRIYILNQIEEVTTDPHPDYNHLNQYKITFETEKRPSEDIQLSIENAENEANERICGDKFKKWVTLSLTAIINNLDGITPKPIEKVVMDGTRAKGVKIWKNDETLRNKIQQLAAGEEPEIDSGWQREE